MGTSFEDIYERHADGVFRFTLRLVGRRDVAEDITSEAFLKLFLHRDRLDADRLPGWLFTVARNQAMDYWRRCAVEARHAVEYDEPIEAPPSHEPSLFDNAALRPAHRLCLVLRYVHGMTRTEIARHTGFSEMQIKGYLQYGRQILRAALSQTKA